VIILRAVAVLALAMLAACASVTSNHPIGIAHGAVSDERILGAWTLVPNDTSNGTASAFILKQGQGLRALLVITSENEWWEADIVPGKVGQHGMLNLRPLLKNGEPVKDGDRIEGYYPLRYTAGADGSISLFLWSEDELRTAVRNKRIAGSETAGRIVLTAEPDALDAFFAAEAESLFAVPYATLIKSK
jgi:hypothetical protein